MTNNPIHNHDVLSSAIAAGDLPALNRELRRQLLSNLSTISVPHALRAMRAWLLWRVESVTAATGKFSKVPHYAGTKSRRNGAEGSLEDISHLVTFDEAIHSIRANTKFAGVGLAMLKSFGVTALDIDGCVTGGQVREDILDLIDGTYAEISPSGRGIRAFWLGTANNGKNSAERFELYADRQFVTFTGNQIQNSFGRNMDDELPVLADDMRETLERLAGAAGDGILSAKDRLRQAAEVDPKLRAIKAAGLYERDMGHGKHSIQCPFERLHSDFGRRAGDGDTVYMQPYTGGVPEGIIKCEHSHKHSQGEYWAAIGFDPRLHELTVTASNSGLARVDVRDGTEDTAPLTEHGNAVRIYDRHGNRLRYVPETGAWIAWHGGAWVWDKDAAGVRALAANLPEQIYAEGARHIRDAEYFATWARSSQKLRTIQASVALLADFPQLRVPMAQVDADPLIVGIDSARQVIDLKTGEVRPARQDDLITKSLAPAAVGNAKDAGRWHKFLDEIFQGDAELIAWMQRFCGYLLTGSTDEQCFLFCYGFGANGKSVFLEMLRHIMADYGRSIPTEVLCETRRQAGGATPDLVALLGARLATCTESEEGSSFAESMLKQLTGGDSMSVRPLYGSPIEFKPGFKLVMSGNHRPMVRGTDDGIWRRVRLVPFNRTFAPAERDPYLLAKLKDEAPGILGWMVDGCLQWQREGLHRQPKVIADATNAYKSEQDILGEWLSECTIWDASAEEDAGMLYSSYKRWCDDNGMRYMSNRWLGRRLPERGFTGRASHGKRYWQGLRLRDPFTDS